VSFNLVAAVTIHSNFGARENKVYHCFQFFPSICHEVMGLDVMILVFWMLNFKPVFFFTLVFNFHQVALCHSVVFLCFFFFFLHCLLKKAFLSLLAILWNSAFRWVYLSFSSLPFTYLFGLPWVAQLVKNPPAMWESWVWSLGSEDPPGDNSFPFQYSDLENCMDCSVGSQRVRHDWVTHFSLSFSSSLSYL